MPSHLRISITAVAWLILAIPVATDEQLLAVRGRRSIRGRSFAASVVNLRTRWRDSHDVTNAVGFVGFRCAYSAVK